MEYDQSSELFIVNALDMAGYVAPGNGNDVDTQGYESCTFNISSGSVNAGTADFVMEEADDDGAGSPGTYATVAADDIIGTLPTILNTDDNQEYRVGYRGKKRWVRLRTVETSAWTDFNMHATAILGHPVTVPTAAQA